MALNSDDKYSLGNNRGYGGGEAGEVLGSRLVGPVEAVTELVLQLVEVPQRDARVQRPRPQPQRAGRSLYQLPLNI